jgi:hypothetical protein
MGQPKLCNTLYYMKDVLRTSAYKLSLNAFV